VEAAAGAAAMYDTFAWGYNVEGALGDGTTDAARAPVPLTTLQGVMVRAVACGARHTLALTKLGDVFAMGLGEYGRLGQGHDRDLYTAERVRCPPGRPVELCVLPCHASRACGLSWRAHGARASASLSKPHASALPRWARMDHTRRAQVPRLIGKSVRSIAAGISHSVAF